MDLTWDASVTAALISGGLALFAALATTYVTLRFKRGDRAASALATQLDGWTSFTNGLRNQIVDLQAENIRCTARLTELQKKNDKLNDRCDELETKVLAVTRELNDFRRPSRT